MVKRHLGNINIKIPMPKLNSPGNCYATNLLYYNRTYLSRVRSIFVYNLWFIVPTRTTYATLNWHTKFNGRKVLCICDLNNACQDLKKNGK